MKSSKSSKSSFLDLLIEYVFSMLGFFGGLYISLYVLSMVGLRGVSEALWFLIGLVVALISGLLTMTGKEATNNEARVAYHKAADEGREQEVTRLGALLKNYRLLTDPLSALAASLLLLIVRGFLESNGAVMIVTVIPVAVLMMILRLPAMVLARKKWAKEHIKK